MFYVSKCENAWFLGSIDAYRISIANYGYTIASTKETHVRSLVVNQLLRYVLTLQAVVVKYSRLLCGCN